MANRVFHIGLILAVLLIATAAVVAPSFAAETTILGEVTDTHQITANNEIYEVGDTPMGDELVYEFVSRKVKVTGSVLEEDGLKIILVTSFEIVEE